MEYVISAATKSSDAKLLYDTLAKIGHVPEGISAMLTTPLFSTRLTLNISRQIQEEFGVPVMFDSGGYATQTGRIDYFDMYSRLLEIYCAERWAAIYTLPDWVPTGHDSDSEVEAKVRQTVEYSRLFYREMPVELKEKALGVVHGRTVGHMEYCLENYLQIGLKHVGFGSFGTAGKDSSVNVVTVNSLYNARVLSELAARNGVSIHVFGVGSLAILPWIARTGATSFDSANWIRSAAFGQVFLPLTRGYNISHRSMVSTIQQGLSRADFERLKSISGHTCKFCESFDQLQADRKARAAHNLLATVDSLDIIAKDDRSRMSAIYEAGSPKYRALWQHELELV